MKKSFYHYSIRRKLILLFTSTASLTVVIACMFLGVYQLVNYRSTLKTEEAAMAQLVAESSAPALLFDDALAAKENLSMLRADPRIQRACLYDKDGKVVASFEAAGRNAACPPPGILGRPAALILQTAPRARTAAGAPVPAVLPSTPALQFTRRHLFILCNVRMQTERVGYLYLDVGLADMYHLLIRSVETMVCVLLLSIFFAATVSSFVQRIISGPIIALTQIATQVSSERNYQLRASRYSDDETGVLMDRFNAMMDQIQQRDSELQGAYASLEDKVAARTSDLQKELTERKQVERDLELAKRTAEEANRAKSAFLANMSHELRTPLNAIIGYSEMLYEDAVEIAAAGTVADLEKVLYSARHLLTLISDILDISKIEAGQMKVYLQPTPASELLRDVLSTVEILAKAHHNSLRVNPDLWSGLLLVDPMRFRQCLLNLLSNSCKFTENGEISLDIQPSPAEDGKWILWTVRDTGMGISPEGCEKLFRNFSQVDGSATRKHGGSGLGLAISQQLCHAMGAHITVDSVLGEGTVFTIHVPAMMPEAEDQQLEPDRSLST